MNGNTISATPGHPVLRAWAWWNHLAHERPVSLIAVLLAVVTAAIYSPLVRFEFVEFDDFQYVAGNSTVQQGLTWQGVLWAFSGYHFANWHPLDWMSHMLDCSFFGLWPGGHHLMNLLFHTTNVVLLFLLLKRMTRAVWRSALVAALFAWHPLHVESVAWISERKDVLSTFFLILTIWAYRSYTQRPAVGRYLTVVLSFALGLMSKPMLVTLPCLLLLLDYWPLGRIRLGLPMPTRVNEPGSAPKITGPLWLLLEKVPLFALSVGASILTVLAQKEEHALASLELIPLSKRAGNAVISYAAYLSKMLWPVDMCAYYPLPREISRTLVICSALVLVCISVMVFRLRQERPYWLFGWAWYLVTLLPVIGLIQVSEQAMADRYTYIPLIGIFIMIVWSAAPWFEAWQARTPIKLASVSVGVLICIVLTGFQLQHWRNGVRLFVHCLEVGPNHSLPHHNLGVALSIRGHKKEAAVQFEEALRLCPNDEKTLFNMALNLMDLGQTSEAMAGYAEVVRLNPRHVFAHLNWGFLLLQQGKYGEAIEHFVAALKLAPATSKAHLNLANALYEQGRTAEAIRHFRVTVDLDPDWPRALSRFACVLATEPDPRFRDGPLAVRLAETANRLTRESESEFLSDLAAAYAEAGQFDEAVGAERRAWRLVVRSEQKTQSLHIRERLELYQSGKPYRLAGETSSPTN